VIREHGKGLVRVGNTKTAAGRRTVPLSLLSPFAVTALIERRHRRFIGEQQAIFLSGIGTLRDPVDFAGQWRKARDQLGVPDVTTHSFRNAVATLIGDAGLSARIGADHLGHGTTTINPATARGVIRGTPSTGEGGANAVCQRSAECLCTRFGGRESNSLNFRTAHSQNGFAIDTRSG